jgi:hypothetical protein
MGHLEIQLVHSPKNHGLAYDLAVRLLPSVQWNKCSQLFLNRIMICIKIIQNVTRLFLKQFKKYGLWLRTALSTEIVHNFSGQSAMSSS